MVRVSPDQDHHARRTLASKEIVFKPGRPKTHIYHIESGAICLYAHAGIAKKPYRSRFPRRADRTAVAANPHDDGPHARRYLCRLHSSRQDRAVVQRATQRRSETLEAVDRELEARRDRLSDAGRSRPVEQGDLSARQPVLQQQLRGPGSVRDHGFLGLRTIAGHDRTIGG